MNYFRFVIILLIANIYVTESKSEFFGEIDNPDTEIHNSVSEPWETIFQKTDGTRYEISSKKDNKFKIILNRYQNPLPMIQFNWKGYTVCYYDYFGLSSNGKELGNIVQIRNKEKVLYDIRGNSYFYGFKYDVFSYIKGEEDPYDFFFRDVTGDGEP